MSAPLRLNIKIVEATNIPKMDIGLGTADPYCSVYLLSRPEQSFKTKIKKGTLKPVWRETFQFEITDESEVICFVLMDWDRATKDDEIGTLDIDIHRLRPGVCYEKWFTMKPAKGVKINPRIRLMLHYAPATETPFFGPDGNPYIIYPQTDEEWETLAYQFLTARASAPQV